MKSLQYSREVLKHSLSSQVRVWVLFGPRNLLFFTIHVFPPDGQEQSLNGCIEEGGRCGKTGYHSLCICYTDLSWSQEWIPYRCKTSPK